MFLVKDRIFKMINEFIFIIFRERFLEIRLLVILLFIVGKCREYVVMFFFLFVLLIFNDL